MTDLERERIAAGIKETILEVKPLLDGSTDLPYDAPLFNDGSGEPSPVALDSLDTLDLVTTIGERFGVDDEKLDAFLRGETDFQAFRTIDDIVNFVLTSTDELSSEPAAATTE